MIPDITHVSYIYKRNCDNKECGKRFRPSARTQMECQECKDKKLKERYNK